MPSSHAASRLRRFSPDALTALVACVAFILRFPSIVQPIGVDQGIFLTSGWAMTRGLVLYRDIWDQKPPGIHLTYAAAVALFGPHASIVFWLDILAAIATCGLVYAIARRTSNAVTARTAAVIYVTLMTPGARYGYGGFLERAVPECFITLLIAAAVLILAPADRAPGRRRILLAAGLIGCAALYKPTALIYFPMLLLWVQRRGPIGWGTFALATGCVAVPAFLAAVWLAASGTLMECWIAVVEYNRAYVASGSGPLLLVNRIGHELVRLIKTDPLWTLGTTGAGLALVDVARRREDNAASLATFWLAAAFIAAAANGIRVYSTYFIPAGAPLALLAGTLFGRAAQAHSRRSRIAGSVAIVSVGCVVALHSHYPARFWGALRADLEATATSGEGRLTYLERFGGYNTGRGYSARANTELAAYISAHSAPGERVYIFGMAPCVYFESRRLPADRFIWTYPGVINLVHRDAFTGETLAGNLARSNAVYIVLERNNRDSLTGWKTETEFESAPMQRVLTDYDLELRIEDFVLYRHRPRNIS